MIQERYTCCRSRAIDAVIRDCREYQSMTNTESKNSAERDRQRWQNTIPLLLRRHSPGNTEIPVDVACTTRTTLVLLLRRFPLPDHYEQQEQQPSPTVRPCERDQDRDATKPALRQRSGLLGFFLHGEPAGAPNSDASTHRYFAYASGQNCCTSLCRIATLLLVVHFFGNGDDRPGSRPVCHLTDAGQ